MKFKGIDRKKTAEALADEMMLLFGNDGFIDCVREMQATGREKVFARRRIRWTLIDELTGENLLEVA